MYCKENGLGRGCVAALCYLVMLVFRGFAAHVINNAYGVQSSKLCHSVNEAGQALRVVRIQRPVYCFWNVAGL